MEECDTNSGRWMDETIEDKTKELKDTVSGSTREREYHLINIEKDGKK